MRSVLITGVSTGIGSASARHFLNKGWLVFGSVRNKEDARHLETDTNFIPLQFDVTDRPAIEREYETVAKVLNGETLDLLVNNAGIANFGPLMHIPVDKFRENMDVNVTGVLEVSQVFLPLLGASLDHKGPKGMIINIGSISGRFVMPLLGPYCASKYALVAVSHALRRELLIHGVRVSLIEPSSAESAIWSKARKAELHVEGTAYARLADMKSAILDQQEDKLLPTQKVVDTIWEAAHAKSPRARYLVTPNNLVNRVVFGLPDKWVDKLFMRAFDKADASSAQFWK